MPWSTHKVTVKMAGVKKTRHIHVKNYQVWRHLTLTGTFHHQFPRSWHFLLEHDEKTDFLSTIFLHLDLPLTSVNWIEWGRFFCIVSDSVSCIVLADKCYPLLYFTCDSATEGWDNVHIALIPFEKAWIHFSLHFMTYQDIFLLSGLLWWLRYN